MNKGDIEFTIGLNTSPAEQELYSLGEKMKSTAHIYSNVFKDVGQGFSTVGSPYQNSNNYGVPSTQVLQKSLAVTENAINKFARTVEQVSMRMVNFTTVGSPYTSNPRVIYSQPANIAGYLPGSTSSNIRTWFPSEHYTHSQAEAINNPNKIFDYLVAKRKAEQSTENPYTGVYDTFSRLNNPQGMYETWKNIFGRKKPLGLPAPFAKKDEEQSSQSENEKDLLETNKKDNTELSDKLVKWGKIYAIVKLIKKTIDAMVKAWKWEAKNVTEINSNLNQEHGFFSTDPIGALRANSDKTRAMAYATIRNMGVNAPVSAGALDYGAKKISDVWQAAMSGREVDERTSIDVQRVKDVLGADLSVAGLLTGEREGKTATDFQFDLMQKFETALPQIMKMNEVEQGQIFDSIRNLLGDDLVNAIVANANKNLKIDATDLKVTLAERLQGYGGTAIPSMNVTDATAKSVDSMSKLTEAWNQLKQIIEVRVTPAFTAFADRMTRFVNWLSKIFNKHEGMKNAAGELMFANTIAGLTNNGINYYKGVKQGSEDKKDIFLNRTRDARDLLKRASKEKGWKAYDDVVSAAFLSQPELETAQDIENLGIGAIYKVVGDRIINGNLNSKSSNPIERAIATFEYKGKKGLEAFKLKGQTEETNWWNDSVNRLFSNPQDMSETERLQALYYFQKNNPVVKEAYSNAFKEGGAYDYNTDMNIGSYLRSFALLMSPQDQLTYYKDMMKQLSTTLDNAVEIEPIWKDSNKNGIIDAGEIQVTVNVKDQNGNTLKKETVAGNYQ